jgi:hypothetical protein
MGTVKNPLENHDETVGPRLGSSKLLDSGLDRRPCLVVSAACSLGQMAYASLVDYRGHGNHRRFVPPPKTLLDISIEKRPAP